MQKIQINQGHDNTIAQLSTAELRQKWSECWGIQPHRYIRREMLEKSLIFKMREMSGSGLNSDQQTRLDRVVQAYKKNPNCFDETRVNLKPGTRLSRMWGGKKYSVMTLADGFEYKDQKYTSLSEIATQITGTRWNGWVFFGLKKKKETS
jgi:hypothetical protein